MGRNTERNEAAKEEQRARILSSALELFVRRGFAATRIADLAGHAGISQGLLYHYFASKDEILVALLESSLPRMDAAAKGLEAMAIPAADKIRLALDALIQGIQENGDTGRHHLLVALASVSDALPPAARDLIARHARNPYAALRRILSKGQKEGTVRDGDPRELALLFWAVVKGLSIHHAVHGNSLGRPTAAALLPLFLREDPPCRA
jgi:AcrR family transcriptional regulator